MKYLPKTEQEFEKANPFEPVYGKHLTKEQKNETIAHFIYELTHSVGKCTFGDVYRAFKTYNSDTCESGIKFYNKVWSDAKFGAFND